MSEIVVRRAKREDCEAIRALIQVFFVAKRRKDWAIRRISFCRNWQTMRRCQMDRKSILKVRFACACILYYKVSVNYFMKKTGFSHIVIALERDGFDGQSLYLCNVATSNEKVIGYTLSYYVYSTWHGKAMYLEDIYVTPDFRGKHVGIKLIKAVAKVHLGYVSKLLPILKIYSSCHINYSFSVLAAILKQP